MSEAKTATKRRPKWRCTVENCSENGRWRTDIDPETAWTRHYMRQHYEAETGPE